MTGRLRRGVAVCVLIVVGLTSCSSGGRSTSGATTTTRPVLTASLAVPAGWHTSLDGKRVARDSADFSTDAPTGPRVTLRTAGAPVDLASLTAELARNDVVSVDDPAQTTIDGHPAVSISLVRRPSGPGPSITDLYLSVRTSATTAALFILEAPTPDFAGVRETLLGIPKLAAG